MLASISFKVGEELKSKGKNESAALRFEQAASKSSDPNIVEASLFEAAVQYEQAQQLSRAALKFEEFCQKYPRSALFKEAVYRAAVSYTHLRAHET